MQPFSMPQGPGAPSSFRAPVSLQDHSRRAGHWSSPCVKPCEIDWHMTSVHWIGAGHGSAAVVA